MSAKLGLWIDHKKVVILSITKMGEKIKEILLSKLLEKINKLSAIT